jgi:uridylate kinase
MGRVNLKHPVAIAGGGAPGRSTDYATVLWAHRYGAQTVYNLTDVDGVYSSDPRKDRSAKHFDMLTWAQYQKVLGMKTWRANDHAPFDPLAAALAARHRIRAVILNGGDLANLTRALHGKSFRGTLLYFNGRGHPRPFFGE